VLRYLVEHAGRLVTAGELLEMVCRTPTSNRKPWRASSAASEMFQGDNQPPSSQDVPLGAGRVQNPRGQLISLGARLVLVPRAAGLDSRSIARRVGVDGARAAQHRIFVAAVRSAW